MLASLFAAAALAGTNLSVVAYSIRPTVACSVAATQSRQGSSVE